MSIRLNAMFHRKACSFTAGPCVVEKVIELSATEFADFRQNLSDNQSFIKDNISLMYDDRNGVSHCLLILGENEDDGILVDSQGYSNARYAAFVPQARQIMNAQPKHKCIAALEDRLSAAVDEVLSRTGAYDGQGPYRVLASELSEKHGIDERYIPLLTEMLGERSPYEFELDDDEIVLFRDQQKEISRDFSVSM